MRKFLLGFCVGAAVLPAVGVVYWVVMTREVKRA